MDPGPPTARPARSVAFDGSLAAGSGVLSALLLLGFLPRMNAAQTAACIVVAGLHNAALFWRRTAPWPAFGVNLTSAIALAILGLPTVILHVAPLIAIYSVSSRSPTPVASVALGAGVSAYVVAAAARGFPEDASTMLGNTTAITAAWVLGALVYKRQGYVESLEIRTRELEQAREELADRAVAEERLRIARELHDVVAHSLSLIAVQSGMGGHVIDDRPEEARKALVAIGDASRQALAEMRRVVGVLREDGGPELAPVAGVEELPMLIRQVAEAGPEVELKIHGEPRPLSPGASVTAYRIVQESLTNVVRHAHASKVRVTLIYRPDGLVVEIVDDGRALAPPDGKGHGLQGMRERVDLFGGRLEAGPLRDGGFRVLATLPEGEAGT